MTLTTTQRRTSLAAVTIHMLGIGLTLGLTFPLVSLTLESWGSPGWIIGLAAAMAALAVLVFMPFLPGLANRLGTIPSMVLGCVVGVAGLGAMYLFQNVAVWLLARFVIGAGLALPWLVGDVWINSVAREQSRGVVIGLYVACFFIGFSAGPLALDAVGIDGAAPFLLACGALLLAIAPLIVASRLAPAIELETGGNLVSAVRAAPVIALGAFLAGFAEACVFSLLAIWGLAVGLDETGALRLLTACIVGGVILQVLLGIVADRFDRQQLLGLAGLAMIATGIGLQMSAGLMVFVAAFVMGGLVLAFYGLSLTLLGERFPPSQLATASAAFLMLYQFGSVTGPVVAGAGLDLFGPVGFVAALTFTGASMAAIALTRVKAPAAA